MGIAAKIRPALPSDIEEISRVIVRALHETNARDYPPHVIASVAENFSPEMIAEKLDSRRIYVAIVDELVVGTGSLDGPVVRSVYVDPTYQGKGIGAQLIDVLEGAAREQAVSTLSVPSSITAEGFYRRLGFVFVRDQLQGEERTIIMKKDI